MTQKAYAEQILEAANMTDCKPTSTPLPMGHSLYSVSQPATADDRRVVESIHYRNIQEAFMYLSTRTRPDIATTVSLFGKSQADPTVNNWKAMNHLLRNLRGTTNHGILMPNNKSKTIIAYSDADWGQDESARRSRTGVMLLYANALFVWSSKL